MMSLPLFYAATLTEAEVLFDLEEDTARHVVQVLRMKIGERLQLTNGKGLLAEAIIDNTGKKSCGVRILHQEQRPIPEIRISMAVSPLKNAARFEWFLEKAAELGISRITPLICSRTERQHIREDRWRNILVAAMLQSQQVWLTELTPSVPFSAFVSAERPSTTFIAHCMEGDKTLLQHCEVTQEACLLIGPEGDFTAGEVQEALSVGFRAVSLGTTRLRTETAALTAAVLLTHQ